MCDTIVACADVTADGVTLFGKNSDREPNEAHQLLCVPAAAHPRQSAFGDAPFGLMRCTHISIPQVERTYEVLLAKPFWIWGAEMGANEHGVAIGNEALFTRVPPEKQPGLIGMDLLRLGLERARTAAEALQVITTLLERHGQSGNCGLAHPMHYDNGFLVADPHEAWVLETAGRHWAAERVTGIRSISNGISLGNQADMMSADLVSHAVERRWCRSRDDFDFGRCYSEPLHTRLGKAHWRRRRTQELLHRHRGRITPATMMAVLRDHGCDDHSAAAHWSPAGGLLCRQICQHAGWGPIRADQTTGSMVSHLASEVQTHYCTGTAAPCTSLFKPLWLGHDVPDTGPEPSDHFDGATLFWQHEVLHRATLRGYPQRLALYRAERDELERRFLEAATAERTASPRDRAALSSRLFLEAEAVEARWLERVQRVPASTWSHPLYAVAWRAHNRQAEMAPSR